MYVGIDEGANDRTRFVEEHPDMEKVRIYIKQQNYVRTCMHVLNIYKYSYIYNTITA